MSVEVVDTTEREEMSSVALTEAELRMLSVAEEADAVVLAETLAVLMEEEEALDAPSEATDDKEPVSVEATELVAISVPLIEEVAATEEIALGKEEDAKLVNASVLLAEVVAVSDRALEILTGEMLPVAVVVAEDDTLAEGTKEDKKLEVAEAALKRVNVELLADDTLDKEVTWGAKAAVPLVVNKEDNLEVEAMVVLLPKDVALVESMSVVLSVTVAGLRSVVAVTVSVKSLVEVTVRVLGWPLLSVKTVLLPRVAVTVEV
jgi:hypothetical protein